MHSTANLVQSQSQSSNSSSESTRQTFGRPRSKSKPSSIFIHPNESNVARADAAAQQLGLFGDTELVKANQYPAEEATAWEIGRGKDIARELMGTRKNTL